jgi:hypothetical protein
MVNFWDFSGGCEIPQNPKNILFSFFFTGTCCVFWIFVAVFRRRVRKYYNESIIIILFFKNSLAENFKIFEK